MSRVKSKKVLRYYCDHCHRGFWSKNKCVQHEPHCFANANRVPLDMELYPFSPSPPSVWKVDQEERTEGKAWDVSIWPKWSCGYHEDMPEPCFTGWEPDFALWVYSGDEWLPIPAARWWELAEISREERMMFFSMEV